MSARSYKEYCAALDKLSKAAQLEFEELWLKLDVSDPVVARDALIAILAALASKYGDMAATIAAEYYEAERAEALGGEYRAALAETVPEDEIERAVRYAAGHLFRGD